MFNRRRVVCSTDILKWSEEELHDLFKDCSSKYMTSTFHHIRMMYKNEDSAVKASRYMMNRDITFVRRG